MTKFNDDESEEIGDSSKENKINTASFPSSKINQIVDSEADPLLGY
jgi:hypothetical protein